MRIEKSEMIVDIKRVYDLVQHPPTRKEYFEMGKYGVSTIKRQWSTWNNALLEIIGSINKERNKEIHHAECLVCKKEFVKKGNQKYCSTSCANRGKPKRKVTLHSCNTCSKIIPLRSVFCKDCRLIGKHLRGGMLLSEKTIQEALYRSDANKYGVIRCHARNVVKNRTQICHICKYDKHVEVCHIKDIGDFPLDTKIGVVNDPSNLVLLCPNCHWEFDHDLLQIGRRGEN